MKYLITGGNKGLGLYLTEKLKADSISRENGFDITKNIQEIAIKSLEYDVFINNAFDGPPQEEWANYAQTNLYIAIYDVWKKANKFGYIFNIGSSGEKTIVAPEPRFETYRISKAALLHASKQGTQSFRSNTVSFKTSLLTLDRLDTPLTRSRASWTGNGIDSDDVLQSIHFCLGTKENTCVDEIVLYCNLNYKN